MKEHILPILASSVILLGLFIVIIAFKNSDTAAEFHVGCYLSTEGPREHYDIQSSLLKEIDDLNDENNHFFDKILSGEFQSGKSHSKIGNELTPRIIELNRNAEKYLQKLVLKRHYQQSNMQLLTGLAEANSDLTSCLVSLEKGAFSPQDCLDLWQDYQNACLGDHQSSSAALATLFEQRGRFLGDLSRLLVREGSGSSGNDLDAKLKQIQRRYRELNEANDQKKEVKIKQHRQNVALNNSKAIQHEVAIARLNNTYTSYSICRKNIKEFLACQETKEKLNKIGTTQTFAHYEELLKLKREKLNRLNEYIVKGDLSENARTVNMRARISDDIRSLIRLLVETDVENDRKCGCSEEEMNVLESEYQDALSVEQALRADTQRLNANILEIQAEIHEYDKEREVLLKKENDQIEALTREHKPASDLLEESRLLREKVVSHNAQILDFERQINQYEFKCNQVKDRLEQRLSALDKVVECRGKESLHSQLQENMKSLLYKEDAETSVFRQNIQKALGQFEYLEAPRALSQKEEQILKALEHEDSLVASERVEVEKESIIEGETEL